jgi:hypothetical protein
VEQAATIQCRLSTPGGLGGPDIIQGRSAERQAVYWDIRFSNICNFRCRSCFHGASSRWFDDAVQLGTEVGDTALLEGVHAPDRLLDELSEFLPEVEEVCFAGGEPLTMDGHYRILCTLDALELYDVRLRYNTNLSHLTYRDHDVPDLWSRFRNVVVKASLDGTGRRGELIRKGLSWPQWVENRRTMKARCPHVSFGVHTTVSVLNVLHLPDLHRQLVEAGLVDYANCSFAPLQVPRHYNLRILPQTMKAEVTATLRAHQAWVRTFGTEHEYPASVVEQRVEAFEGLLAFMQVEDWSWRTVEFLKITDHLDQLRGEQTLKVLPELAPLFAHGEHLCRGQR